MHRNVSIVIALLVVVVIAGYLVWIRSKVSSPVTPRTEEVVRIVSPSPLETVISSPSATPEKEATSSMKEKTSTQGAAKK